LRKPKADTAADPHSPPAPAGVLVLLAPAVAKLVLHLLTVRGYGFHSDELYYIACSNHLDWGYVDQPPFSILLLFVQRHLFGDSLLSIRFLPALAGALTVLLTGLIARKLGARLFGQLLAGLCALVATAYLAINHYFSMNAFDLLFWTLAFYLIVAIVNGGTATLWVWFGLVIGLGFENKLSILFLGFGLLVGLLLTRERRRLWSRWILVGAAVAALLMLPNIIWQMEHGWPTLEWMHNARVDKMVAMSLPAYLFEQVMNMHPLSLLVWGAGLVVLFLHPALTRYRALGICYLVVLAVMVVGGGKAYYLVPAYTPLFAAGAFAWERWLRRPWLQGAFALFVIGAGVLPAPMGLPLLPVDSFVRYARAFKYEPSGGERASRRTLPSFFFAGMFGARELAARVDTVYHSLPDSDRVRCAIYCNNYSQAGAIDSYGRKYDLPPAISGHNSYYFWGPRGYDGSVLLVVGESPELLRDLFGEVTVLPRFSADYAQPAFIDIPICIARRPKQSIQELWPRTRKFI
jgi:hypothetical protein